MKQTQEEKDAVMAKLDQIIADCNKLGCKMIVVVPVSYTHLDVYKRQVIGRRNPREEDDNRGNKCDTQRVI